MKILAIGNSFSEDACRYIHKIAAADGQTVKTVNLYIGGCPLQTHYYNILENNAAYDFQFNGESTRLKVNIKQVLMSDNWDAVTFQQVSQAAPHFETYEPYLSALADYVRTYLPHTNFYMHQTWAYEADSERLKNAGFDTPQKMLEHIRAAYQAAARPHRRERHHSERRRHVQGLGKRHGNRPPRHVSCVARLRAVSARPCVVRLLYRKKREAYPV